jgi:hypothetical protein
VKEHLIIKLWLLIFLLLIPYNYVHPQQETEALKDSVLRFQGVNPTLHLNYKFHDLILYVNPDFLPNNLPPHDNPSTIWLRTELALSSSLMFQEKTGADRHYTSILYQQYLEDSKFDPVRYVLGMAQLGAVGYLAYKHIKKYGFWK